ncbi:MAG: UDP-3-O-[3-hydroxymyristoyl] N-acetylglucosamine deacetylase [Robiginitomaculum sp.]|nr:MAG: UDP-3-O-[3-hydroxymyristoyl] N-acetylglucosamine deacetylase [Robiginitomaculum sp.]
MVPKLIDRYAARQEDAVPETFPFTKTPLWQHTLGQSVSCAGPGLHLGGHVRLGLHPAQVDTGLVFRRTDVGASKVSILLHPKAVCQTRRGTSVGNAQGVSIATTEHVLAALSACAIDNAYIDIDGPEVPAMDGCAKAFTDMISKASVVAQKTPRRFIEVCKTVTCRDGARQVRLDPADGLLISAHIEYPNTAIGTQDYEFQASAAHFIADIAPARTFALAHEVAALKEAGLGLGGTLDNCLLVDGMDIENPDGLRFADEFVRHKVLDILGDIALLGAPLRGRFTSNCAGHALNNALVQALMADPEAWRWSIPASA